VDKILFYFAKLFQNNANVTLVNTQYILYLSKLYPSRLNKKFCTILMNTFKSLWDNLHHCKNSKHVFTTLIMYILILYCNKSKIFK